MVHIGGPIIHHWMLIKRLMLLGVKHLTGHEKCDIKAGEVYSGKKNILKNNQEAVG